MNKFLKAILILSLVIFSAVGLSGCSSEKEKIAKEYTGVWQAEQKNAWSGSDQRIFLILEPNKTNENILDVTVRIFDKNNSKFSAHNKELEMLKDDKTSAIIDEKTKTVQLQDPFKTWLPITTEGDKKIMNYNASKFVKISDEPKAPELQSVKF